MVIYLLRRFGRWLAKAGRPVPYAGIRDKAIVIAITTPVWNRTLHVTFPGATALTLYSKGENPIAFQITKM